MIRVYGYEFGAGLCALIPVIDGTNGPPTLSPILISPLAWYNRLREISRADSLQAEHLLGSDSLPLPGLADALSQLGVCGSSTLAPPPPALRRLPAKQSSDILSQFMRVGSHRIASPVRRTASNSNVMTGSIASSSLPHPAPPPGPMGTSAMRLFSRQLAQPRWPSAKSRLSGGSGRQQMTTTFTEGFPVQPQPGWEAFRPRPDLGMPSSGRTGSGSTEGSWDQQQLSSYTEGLLDPGQGSSGSGPNARQTRTVRAPGSCQGGEQSVSDIVSDGRTASSLTQVPLSSEGGFELHMRSLPQGWGGSAWTTSSSQGGPSSGGSSGTGATRSKPIGIGARPSLGFDGDYPSCSPVPYQLEGLPDVSEEESADEA